MESTIAATERLRREGRWEDATWRRDQERKRLRGEGLTRRESNEQSWEWMIREYPPLTDHEIDWYEAYQYLAMAHFPLGCAHVDHGSEPPMSDIWWGYCNLIAWQPPSHPEDSRGC